MFRCVVTENSKSEYIVDNLLLPKYICITQLHCWLMFNGKHSLSGAYNNDGDKWFYALSRNMNLTTEVYVGGTTYTYFSNTGSAAAIRTVSGGTVTYSYTQQYSQRLVPVTLYDKDALVDHPDLGTVLIHRCVLTRSSTLGQQQSFGGSRLLRWLEHQSTVCLSL